MWSACREVEGRSTTAPCPIAFGNDEMDRGRLRQAGTQEAGLRTAADSPDRQFCRRSSHRGSDHPDFQLARFHDVVHVDIPERQLVASECEFHCPGLAGLQGHPSKALQLAHRTSNARPRWLMYNWTTSSPERPPLLVISVVTLTWAVPAFSSPRHISPSRVYLPIRECSIGEPESNG